jgi:sugar transferase (PEP-CTERM/EpsH1 system associated)
LIRKHVLPLRELSHLPSNPRENILNILFVVPYVPDPVRVRPYQFIRGLVKRGHNMSVATLWTSQWEFESLSALEQENVSVHALRLPKWQSAINCLKAVPGRVPLQAVYCWQPEMQSLLARLVSTGNGRTAFDVVHIEHLRGANYGLWLQDLIAKKGYSLPVVWDSVDSISLLFRLAAQRSLSLPRRLMTAFELPRTTRYESELIHRFGQVLTTSETDAQALRGLANSSDVEERITVLPNGVDLEYFHPLPKNRPSAKRLVMTGKMSYHANISMAVHFVEQIWPHIQGTHPEIELWIVGKDPSREVQALSSKGGVHVTGTVPDIRPYLWEAAISVAPLTYSVGVQNKVLEAMACGTPVVVSSAAAKSLKIRDRQEVYIADEPEAFAQAVTELLQDADLRDQLSRAGRDFVERNHDWARITRELEAIYDGVIPSRS